MKIFRRLPVPSSSHDGGRNVRRCRCSQSIFWEEDGPLVCTSRDRRESSAESTMAKGMHGSSMPKIWGNQNVVRAWRKSPPWEAICRDYVALEYCSDATCLMGPSIHSADLCFPNLLCGMFFMIFQRSNQNEKVSRGVHNLVGSQSDGQGYSCGRDIALLQPALYRLGPS